MREEQAQGFPQVHCEHGAPVHREFEGRVLGWAHARVALRSLRYAARAARTTTTRGSRSSSRYATSSFPASVSRRESC